MKLVSILITILLGATSLNTYAQGTLETAGSSKPHYLLFDQFYDQYLQPVIKVSGNFIKNEDGKITSGSITYESCFANVTRAQSSQSEDNITVRNPDCEAAEGLRPLEGSGGFLLPQSRFKIGLLGTIEIEEKTIDELYTELQNMNITHINSISENKFQQLLPSLALTLGSVGILYGAVSLVSVAPGSAFATFVFSTMFTSILAALTPLLIPASIIAAFYFGGQFAMRTLKSMQNNSNNEENLDIINMLLLEDNEINKSNVFSLNLRPNKVIFGLIDGLSL